MSQRNRIEVHQMSDFKPPPPPTLQRPIFWRDTSVEDAQSLHAVISARSRMTAHLGVVNVPEERNNVLLDQVPGILLQAVVELSDRTDEGHLIQLVTPPWFEIVRLMKHDPKAMYQFDWRKWEEIVAGAYKAAGFDVVLTPASGDRGRDVIATRDDVGSIRFIDQVKAYAPNNLVSANDVRALVGVLSMDAKASKGIITTTSDFAPGVYTDPDIQRLTPTRLELRPGSKLVEWLVEVAKQGKS
jgi:restriction system protein